MQTLHQSKCHESQQRAKRAAKNITKKTLQKQKSTLKKIRKKTWGF